MRACGCCVWLRERGMVGDSTCRVLAKMPSLEKREPLARRQQRRMWTHVEASGVEHASDSVDEVRGARTVTAAVAATVLRPARRRMAQQGGSDGAVGTMPAM